MNVFGKYKFFIISIKRCSSKEIVCSASSFPVFPDISN